MDPQHLKTYSIYDKLQPIPLSHDNLLYYIFTQLNENIQRSHFWETLMRKIACINFNLEIISEHNMPLRLAVIYKKEAYKGRTQACNPC